MDTITNIFHHLNSIVWGYPMLILIVGVGAFLMAGLAFMPIRKLAYGFRMLFKGREETGEEGEISPFNALMTALSATIGTGNIAGVATAVSVGGPGAIFWMWITAIVGLATKYAEAVCAVKFREVDANGDHVGGPMYFIRNGLGEKWAWLGFLFALFGSIAAFGIGNMVQSNSIADALQSSYNIPKMATGVVLAVLVGAVILGGIKRIASVAGKLVPFMAILYTLGGLIIIVMNIGQIPAAFGEIFSQAFTGTAAAGGFLGMVIKGVARGVFSNEAGLGSAPIAHAAAKTTDPVRQGSIAMLGTFIDTIIVCSITGLVIVISGLWTNGTSGAALTSKAFEMGLPHLGSHGVSLGITLFAFTTMLGWAFYGEKCLEYLFGTRVIKPYRVLWVIAVFTGTVLKLNFVWLLADTLNALMAIPNLIGLLLLSPIVFKITKEYKFNNSR
ncbi:MAG: sodium:alanine symporter family protein [Proteobacteria bacterium]|nr:sodium:alanine symporter family protein [Pseudomonadota bacterium]MBU1737915.1 sodium:alanine symporter family protein [Pseudomonadota bacterium]